MSVNAKNDTANTSTNASKNVGATALRPTDRKLYPLQTAFKLFGPGGTTRYWSESDNNHGDTDLGETEPESPPIYHHNEERKKELLIPTDGHEPTQLYYDEEANGEEKSGENDLSFYNQDSIYIIHKQEQTDFSPASPKGSQETCHADDVTTINLVSMHASTTEDCEEQNALDIFPPQKRQKSSEAADNPIDTQRTVTCTEEKTNLTPNTLSELEHPGSNVKRASFVWKHFDKISNNPHITICRYCRAHVKIGKPGGCKKVGTTSMIKHLQHRHSLMSPPTKNKLLSPPKASVQKVTLLTTPTIATIGGEQHPSEFGEVIPSARKQLSIQESIAMSQKFPPKSIKAIRCNTAVARFISFLMLPFSLVEHEEFHLLLHEMCPRYEVPTQHFLCDTAFPKLEEDISKCISKELCLAVGSAAHFTSDCWTSNQNKSYLCVTAHWVSSNNENTLMRHQATLTLTLFSESHTASNISEKLQAVTDKWLTPLQIELGCLATDNAANYLKYVCQKAVSHVPCIAHCINLIIRNAFKGKNNAAVQEAIDVAQQICSHFRSSSAATEAIRLLQRKNGLPEHKFLVDVPTRWNSTLNMLERFLEQKTAVIQYIDERVSTKLNVQPMQWSIMQDLVDILTIFKECTTILSSDDASIAWVLPALEIMEYALKEFLDKRKKPSTSVGNGEVLPSVAFASYLLDSLHGNKHIRVIRQDLKYHAASLFEPIYRDSTLERLREGKTMGINIKEVEDYILQHGVQLYKKTSKKVQQLHSEQNESTATHSIAGSENTSVHLGNEPSCSKETCSKDTMQSVTPVGSMFQRIMYSARLAPTGQPTNKQKTPKRASDHLALNRVRQELESYIREILPLHFVQPKTSSLSYWEQKLTVWPSLSKVAIWHLSCPASSVFSERLFSEAGNLVTKLRSRLTPAHVSQMVFIRANRKWLPHPKGFKMRNQNYGCEWIDAEETDFSLSLSQHDDSYSIKE